MESKMTQQRLAYTAPSNGARPAHPKKAAAPAPLHPLVAFNPGSKSAVVMKNGMVVEGTIKEMRKNFLHVVDATVRTREPDGSMLEVDVSATLIEITMVALARPC
jgi:hypothetical protein